MKNQVNFIGIGAMRSGTTWIDKNLRKHPQVYMPPIKEIHYFDRLVQFRGKDHLRKKFFSSNSSSKNFRKYFFKYSLLNLAKFEINNMIWGFKYFLNEPNNEFYINLFSDGKEKIKGEITPAYATLDLNMIKEMYSINPEAKIIYILRNPVDRTWSHLRMRKSKNVVSERTVEEIKKLVDLREVEERNKYTETINKYSQVFGRENLLICFFDELVNTPNLLYQKICKFIGVDDSFIPIGLLKVENKSKASIGIPSDIEVLLYKKYYNQINDLADFVGSYALEWKKNADQKIKI